MSAVALLCCLLSVPVEKTGSSFDSYLGGVFKHSSSINCLEQKAHSGVTSLTQATLTHFVYGTRLRFSTAGTFFDN